MKQTPLYRKHIDLAAKIAPFGGYDMPIQYSSGIISEHEATRSAATIFDTCHMGEFDARGSAVVADLDKLVTRDVATQAVGSCRYYLMCNESGGVIDDLIMYRMADNRFFIVVNAGTQETDFEWIQSHLSTQSSIENIGEQTAKLDIQGPQAPGLFQSMIDTSLEGLKYYRLRTCSRNGKEVLVSRTGYTGEIGVEVYCDTQTALGLWDECLEKGITPAGLGCRDTLRLEMGYPLYGHELSDKRNAADYAGGTPLLSNNKSFVGSRHILNDKAQENVFTAIELHGRRATRSDDVICTAGGEEIGIVTSGSYSPTLRKALALGYVSKDAHRRGMSVALGKSRLTGTITALPFVKQTTARKALARFL
ncbi:MAG: glycine cleavage system aminomethyltransferase GcvT [Chitinivibrionales bacterium]|nr:glycine cleavage system aminomethyltransferase GcvT [Chitinivibrionales bacterium]